ncbi:MAG TPA: cytochrome c oxidase assembly protein [Acetobacteraceae bacterium]|nr:cytochrome c oxidase assembly protein [Acetobacteraceae bacterium]
MDETSAAASRAILLRRRNRRLGVGIACFAAGMVGLAFASVPLYQLFCRITGYNGTVQTAGLAAPGAGEQVVNIRFNATTQPALPWRFAPAQGTMRLRVGEEGLAFYRARNLGGAAVTGVATYNVTPEVVGKYFHKTACFCFERQTLEAGQEVDMPVSFWVDPRIAEDPNTGGIRTITVSYSFFRTLDDAERAGAMANAGPHVGTGGDATAAAPRRATP